MTTRHDLFSRTTSFIIPGSKNSPGVHVFVTENSTGGLNFTVNVINTSKLSADLRGLFFNFNSDSKLSGLAVTGGHVTGFNTNNVIDLGNGANMQGAASPFDVGIQFGTAGKANDNISSTTFTLSGGGKSLTLDDIALVQFGARTTSVGGKLVAISPAAPDAHDDHRVIFEDGTTGLNAPAHTKTGQLFELLSNDTDANHDKLTITQVAGAEHGTVQIVDGADADFEAGDAVLYTANSDYSGADSFTYAIANKHGGTDYADVFVSITAVADAPTLSYEILAGNNVNEIIVRVTATQTDADSSEFIDRIELSGIPDGVNVSIRSVNPTGEPDQITQDFVLTLPSEMDNGFDLSITAVAKETSNGDEQTTIGTVGILYDYTHNESIETFKSTNQSMWGPGDAFSFVDDRFLGAQDTLNDNFGSTFYANYNFDYKLGLQSKLTVGGGNVDASAPYFVDVETLFNKTTNWLHFDTAQQLDINGANFSTKSPLLTYTLDLIAKINGYINLGVEISIGGTPAVKVFGETIIPAIPGFSFGDSVRVPVDIDASTNLVTINGDSALDIPIPDTGLTLTVEVPYIETTSHVASNKLVSSGSDKFLSLTADIDAIAGLILSQGTYDGGLGLSGSFGPVNYDLTFLDYKIVGSLGIRQDFAMTFGQLNGKLTFEDGFTQHFILGDSFDVKNAFSHDTNMDGQLQYSIDLKPAATFSSDLSLVLSLEHTLKILMASVSVSVPLLPDPSFSIGPVFSIDEVLASTSIPVVGIPDFSLSLGSHEIYGVA